MVACIGATAATIRIAGAEQLPLKLYTTADGLASDRIHCMLADSHGFLWFGTSDGISRFDGQEFVNLTKREGVPGTSVRALFEARDSTYWAATDGGLYHWDPAGTGKPEVVHLGTGAGDEARALLPDGAGGFWVGTRGGLVRLTGSPGAWHAEPQGLERGGAGPALQVNVLCHGEGGALWIGTEMALLRRSRDGTVVRVAPRDGPSGAVRSLLEDRDRRVWVGTWGRGLFVLEPGKASDGEAPVLRPMFRRDQLAGNPITALFQASDGAIWAGCFGGLSEISADATAIRNYKTREGLSALGLWSLGEDRNGNLWIGSDDAGLMRMARNGFRVFDANDGLQNRCVASLFEDREGAPCAFTRGTDLEVDRSLVECYDGSGSRFRAQRPGVRPGVGFGWGVAQIAMQDSRGEWWVPTDGGLYRFPAVLFDRLASVAPRRIYTSRDGLPSDNLSRLFEDSRGDFWVAAVSLRHPLVLWVRREDAFRSVPTDGTAPDGEPLCFAEDRGGAVWIGYRNGLARVRGGRLKLLEAKDGVPPGSIGALHMDGSGRLWLATDGAGIARIDRPEDEPSRFVRFGVEQGLASSSTSSLAEDRWGRIYVGTARGLDRLDPAGGAVQHFTIDDGLARGDVETGLSDRTGALWFGSCQGLSRLEPVREPPRRPPPILITRVFADGVRQPLPDLGARQVRLPNVGPGSAPVQIDFLALDFRPGGRPRYQYALEGVDPGWSAPTDQRSVIYGRLPAGSYHFRVRGIANDGSIGETPAEVRFTVLAPLWKRPETIAAFAALLAAVAYLLHRYRLKSALAIEQLRTRVATDLHDDVGAGLSEIAILSELAGQKSGEGARPLVAEIGENARHLVDAMSDIVWSTDPRRDDLSSLAQRIGQFGAATLERQGVAWSLEVSDGFEAVPLDPERRRELFLIAREALTNVARHSRCRRAGVRIAREGGEVAMDITDDGVGFSLPAGAARTGYGLENMKRRVRGLGGSVDISSGPTGGTRIRVRAPLTGKTAGIST